MNRRRIEKMIPIAMKKIIEANILDDDKNDKDKGKDKKLPSISGYIDSYGPTIIQSGLKSTICFYEKDDSKKKINEIIAGVLKDANLINKDSLKDLINEPNENIDDLKRLVFEAIVAWKLAAKTFPKGKPEEGE